MVQPHFSRTAFTLAELLITLGILAVIATFTIPKVLEAEQGQKYNAEAKEAFSAISQAYQAYLNDNGSPAASTNVIQALFTHNYFNAVNDASGVQFDLSPAWAAGSGYTCDNNSRYCVRLHNGAILAGGQQKTFYDTSNKSVIEFWFDPDGVYHGDNSSLRIFLYYDGRIVERGNCLPNTCYGGSGCTVQPASTDDPSWWSKWN